MRRTNPTRWGGWAALALFSTSIVLGDGINESSPPINSLETRAMAALQVTHLAIAEIAAPEMVSPGTVVSFEFKGQSVTMQLEPSQVFADNAVIVEIDATGVHEHPPRETTTMRGVIAEIPGAKVAASLDGSGFRATILMPDGELYQVDPLSGTVQGAGADEYAVYLSKDKQCGGETCGLVDVPPSDVAVTADASGCDGICVVELAVDTDFQFIQAMGSGTNATNVITNCINSINLQYETQVTMTHRIVKLVLRTTADDPYPEGQTADQYLAVFRDYWNATETNTVYDEAFLCTGQNFPQNVLGIAYFATGCGINRYGAGHLTVGACGNNVVGHELGHIWGATHCTCPSSTMNAVNSCANTFLNNPDTVNNSLAQITAFRSAATCLSSLEAGNASIPFTDNFATSTFNANLWTGVSGAIVSSASIAPPSAPFAADLRGGTSLRSAYLDASYFSAVTVAFQVERGGAGDPPEVGDDLVLEWRDANGVWQEVNRQSGTGSSAATFTAISVPLPTGARHRMLRVRFRNTGNQANGDDWFVDNVSVTGTANQPGNFSLIEPNNNGRGASQKPRYRWGAATNATSYRLEVDDASDFSSPLLNITTTFTQYTGLTPLAAGHMYFWRVTAINPQLTRISNAQSFTTLTGLPQAFAMTAPTDGQLITTANLNFAWQQSFDASFYTISYDDNPDMSSPIQNATTFAPTGSIPFGRSLVTNGVSYYARVTATNALGSVNTPIVRFVPALPPPPTSPCPTAPNFWCSVVPFPGALVSGTRVPLQWLPAPNAWNYQLQIFPDANSASAILDTQVTETSYDANGPVIIFPPGACGVYRWKVTGVNPNGTCPAGSGEFFLIQPQTPGTGFGLVGPPDKLEIFTSTENGVITFNWTSHPNAATYRLEFDDDPMFRSPRQYSVTGTSLPVAWSGTQDSNNPGPFVYWRVVVNQNNGQKNFVATPGRLLWYWQWAFHPPASPPAAVGLTTPDDGQTFSGQQIPLSWQATALANSYRVVVEPMPGFGLPRIFPNISGTSLTLNRSQLPAGDTFVWRVIAVNSFGETPSADRAFSIWDEPIGIDPIIPGDPSEKSK